MSAVPGALFVLSCLSLRHAFASFRAFRRYLTFIAVLQRQRNWVLYFVPPYPRGPCNLLFCCIRLSIPAPSLTPKSKSFPSLYQARLSLRVPAYITNVYKASRYLYETSGNESVAQNGAALPHRYGRASTFENFLFLDS
jgi:hypothetical protein